MPPDVEQAEEYCAGTIREYKASRHFVILDDDRQDCWLAVHENALVTVTP